LDEDTPMTDISSWQWVIIGIMAVLTLAWLFFSLVTVYQFAVNRRKIGVGRWFLVGFLMFILCVGMLGKHADPSANYGYLALLMIFALGISIGEIGNERQSARAAPANFRVATSELWAEGEFMVDSTQINQTTQFDAKYCFECGAIIRSKAEICPKCGVRQPIIASGMTGSLDGRSKIAAALFAIFLGGLGIHKFYLGQIGWGILYLIFCWTFIPAFVGLIEGIVYLSMSDSAFAAKYGTVT
jgi:TM2 domain-containing membrane protein YozV/ribosomal protein L40E